MPPWLRGQGPGLGHRRVLDAAGLDPRARRPRGREGQAVRAHAGDPAADRPVAARGHRPRGDGRGRRSPSTATCCRPTAARAPRRSAAATSRCTTRARAWSRPSTIGAHPITDTVRRDLGRHRRRARRSRPRLLRGRARRGRHERRDDRRGPVRRGAGHRRGRCRSRRDELDELLGLAEARHPRDLRRCSARWSRSRPRPAPPRDAARSCSRPPTPTRREEIARRARRDAGARPSSCVPRPDDVPDVEETGATLEDNARLKAVALRDATGLPAIADDTGLEVDALDGAPGVRSARFAGERRDLRRQRGELLLERLDGVPPERRTARFATVALARWPDGREVAALGDVEGTIADASRGATAGFGYDPVFVPDEGDGRTFAEMTASREARDLAPGPRVPYPGRDGLRRWSRRPRRQIRGVTSGSHRHRRVRGRPQGPRGRARVPRARRAPLRRELLAAPDWEVDLHPEEGCEGPVDLYLSLEIDPRVLLGFEDAVIERGRRRGPARRLPLPAQLHVGAAAACRTAPTCSCSPPSSPASGGPDLPLEVSAIDSIPAAPTRRSARCGSSPTSGVAAAHPRRRRGLVRDARPLPRR